MAPRKPNLTHWTGRVRYRTGLGQEEFAARLGVGREMVARWEGTGSISNRHAERIRTIFHEAVVKAEASSQGPENTEMSDPGSRLPPGLEGFLERHGKHISESEKDLLRRATHLADPSVDTSSDDFWWDYVKTVLRKYFRPPDGKR